MSEFQGKVAVITGAGNGLGRSHALEFARRGARVVVNDPGVDVDGKGGGDAADLVVEEIRAAGGEAIANKASVADKAGAKSLIDDAVDKWGTVDILVNNAGILRDKTFIKMDLDDFDEVMQVHLNGTAYVTHAAWKIMYEKSYGRIVFTTSGAGLYGNFGQANYAAAKMGMVGLMYVLVKEGSKRDIRINCLSPAASTRMIGTIPGRDQAEEAKLRKPEMVTPAVLLMCSDHAPNGKIIRAAAGRFSTAAVYHNDGVMLGLDSSWEAVEANRDAILDMSAAEEGNPRVRHTALDQKK